MSANTKIAAMMVALMAFSAPVVFADNGPGDGGNGWHHDGGMSHGKEHMMAKILGLSDDQVKQLKDLHQKQKDAMKSVFEQMKSQREAFEAEIVKASPDMNKITSIQTQIKTLTAQMVDDHLNSLLDVKKVLTPEQFAGYMALKKEHMMKMKMMHHKFGHDGSGHDGHKSWGDKDKDQDQD